MKERHFPSIISNFMPMYKVLFMPCSFLSYFRVKLQICQSLVLFIYHQIFDQFNFQWKSSQIQHKGKQSSFLTVLGTTYKRGKWLSYYWDFSSRKWSYCSLFIQYGHSWGKDLIHQLQNSFLGTNWGCLKDPSWASKSYTRLSWTIHCSSLPFSWWGFGFITANHNKCKGRTAFVPSAEYVQPGLLLFLLLASSDTRLLPVFLLTFALSWLSSSSSSLQLELSFAQLGPDLCQTLDQY